MVEAPGTAPGSNGFITMAIYRHSRCRQDQYRGAGRGMQMWPWRRILATGDEQMNVIVKMGGVVTLPDEVIEGLDLEPGSEVAFTRGHHGEFTVEKVPQPKGLQPSRDEIERQIRAAIGAAGPGPGTDEYMALMRGDD